jgi:hypothetical protein
MDDSKIPPIEVQAAADVRLTIARAVHRFAKLHGLESELQEAMITRIAIIRVNEGRKATTVDLADACMPVIERFIAKHGKELL